MMVQDKEVKCVLMLFLFYFKTNYEYAQTVTKHSDQNVNAINYKCMYHSNHTLLQVKGSIGVKFCVMLTSHSPVFPFVSTTCTIAFWSQHVYLKITISPDLLRVCWLINMDKNKLFISSKYKFNALQRKCLKF